MREVNMFGVFVRRVCYDTHSCCWDKYTVIKRDYDIFRGSFYQSHPDSRLVIEFVEREDALEYVSHQPDNCTPYHSA